MYTGYIYKIINKVNNKIYIGQTIHDINKRLKQHFRCALNDRTYRYKIKLYRAIRKYGIENFYIELVEKISENTVNTLSCTLNIKEIFYIAQYDSYIKGYNSTLGGCGSLGRKHSKETRQKIAENAKGNSWTKGRVVSEETKKLQSKIALEQYVNGRIPPRLGKPTPEERRIRISQTLKCNTKAQEATARRNKERGKRVVQLTLNLEFVNEFESITEAWKSTSISNSTIGSCCNHKINMAGGYKWMHYDEYAILSLPNEIGGDD